VWGTEQQSAFDALKDSLANAETLAYFDRNAEETKLALWVWERSLHKFKEDVNE